MFQASHDRDSLYTKFDPLMTANEGRTLSVIDYEKVFSLVSQLQAHPKLTFFWMGRHIDFTLDVRMPVM